MCVLWRGKGNRPSSSKLELLCQSESNCSAFSFAWKRLKNVYKFRSFTFENEIVHFALLRFFFCEATFWKIS